MRQIKIIFENQHFLCALKPRMTLSVPSRFEKSDEREVLGRILEKQLRKTLFPVHRLDFEVGGLILFAKTKEAQSILNTGFEDKSIRKTYLAKTHATHNFAIGEKLEWRCVLAKGKRRAFEASHGKNSITEAKLIKIDNGVSFFHLNPITGRSHQLRFEMFRHHVPIDGDELYGSSVKSIDGIELDCFHLDFNKLKNKNLIETPDFLKNELVE